MQDRQALGHHHAQVFQFFGAEAVLPAVQQQRGGHVETLQGLGDGAGEQGQQHELPRTGCRANVGVVVLAQQPLLDQRGQPLVNHLIQLLRRPAQEQFGLQVRVQRVHILAQQFAAHARAAEEEARQQRRQGEDVQHVVTVIGHQYRVAFIQVQDATQGVLLLGHQVHPAHVFDQRLAVAIRQGGVRRVGHLAQQGQVQVEHAGQGALVQGQAAGGQQSQGHQVDRVDRGRLVEVTGHGFAQAGGGCIEPGRAVLRAVILFTPAGLLLVEEAGQADRLAEVHVYLAKALF